MRRTIRQLVRTVTSAALLLGLTPPAGAQITETEFGQNLNAAANGCLPTAMNEAGDVLLHCPLPNRSYLYVSQTQLYWQIQPPPLAYLPSSHWEAALNNSGTVAGRYCTPIDCTVFLWSRETSSNAGSQPLITSTNLLPLAINDLGEILFSGGSPFNYQLRRADGTMVPIEVPSSFRVVPQWPTQSALNNLSQVALSSMWERRLAVWSPMQGLVELPPPPVVQGDPNGTIDQAYITGLNDSGVIVGQTNAQSFIYTPATGYRLLAPTAGYSIASHVNSLGGVSGWMLGPYNSDVPIYWSPTGSAMQLSSTANRFAYGSNAAGLVFGRGSDGRLWLWNTAPPPPTPQQLVSQISAALTTYVSNSLIQSQDAAGLTSKVEAINLLLGKSDTPAAKNVLQALGNQVNALEKSKRISGTTASSLRDAINAAAATL